MDLTTFVLNSVTALVTPFFNFIYHNIYSARGDETGITTSFVYIISGILAVVFYILVARVNLHYFKNKKNTKQFIITNTLLLVYVILITFPLLGCAVILNYEYRNQCKDHIYESLANKKEDYTICQKTSSGGQQCYYNIAKTLNEYTCSKIEKTLHRDNCYNTLVLHGLQNNSEICRKIATDELRDTCLLDVAKNTRNAVICNEVSTPSHRDSCYMYSAQSKKDLKKCYEIVNNNNKNICITNVATAVKEVELCNTITNDEDSRDGCFEKVAQQIADSSSCRQ